MLAYVSAPHAPQIAINPWGAGLRQFLHADTLLHFIFRQHFLGLLLISEPFTPESTEKRTKEGEIASSNCSGAGLVVKTCQSHQVCLTGPLLQRVTFLQGTEATGGNL